MADTKITGLIVDAAPTGDDLVVTVNDPAGTPANRKVTLASLAGFMGTSLAGTFDAAGAATTAAATEAGLRTAADGVLNTRVSTVEAGVIPSIEVYGHSWVAGAGSTATRYGWAERIAHSLGNATLTKVALNGAFVLAPSAFGGPAGLFNGTVATDQVLGPYQTRGGVKVCLIGFNDYGAANGNTAGEAAVENALVTAFSRLLASRVIPALTAGPVLNAGVTYSASWNALADTTISIAPGEAYNATAGCYAEFSTDTDYAGEAISAVLPVGNGNGFIATVTVDGVTKGSIDSRSWATFEAAHSNPGSTHCVRLPAGTVAAGVHTIRVTFTSIVGFALFTGFVIEGSSPPPLVIPLVPNIPSNAVAGFNAQAAWSNTRNTNAAAGFPSAVLVNISTAMCPNYGTGSEASDLRYWSTSVPGHPNNLGYARIAKVLDLAIRALLTADNVNLMNADPAGDLTAETAARIAGDAASQQIAGHTAKSVPVSDTGTLADLVMGASTILARLAAGGIVAATPTQLKTLLAIVPGDVSGLGSAALVADSTLIHTTGNETMAGTKIFNGTVQLIGGTSLVAPFSVSHNDPTANVASFKALNVTAVTQLSAIAGAQAYGLYAQPTIHVQANISSGNGIQGLRFAPTTMEDGVGGYTVNHVDMVYLQFATGLTTITELNFFKGVAISAPVNCTNWYGLQLDYGNQTFTGTAIGLKIKSMAGTTNWGMQVDDFQSYHVGKLALGGSTAPQYALDLQGTAQDRGVIGYVESIATPTNPASSSQCVTYMKADKFVIAYNDAGTMRYKYLDLTGTGVTWVHTTVAP